VILLVLLAFAGLALFEVPGLVERGYWRELAAFTICWAAALGLSLWLALGQAVPFVALALARLILPGG
jgi:hypothetical protein